MRTRTLTIASFFSIAMAATLLAALYTTQVRRPEPAQASTVALGAEAAPRAAGAAGGAFGLETFRDIAKASNAGVVNINTSKTVKGRSPQDLFGDDLMERFFGQPAPDREDAPRAAAASVVRPRRAWAPVS